MKIELNGKALLGLGLLSTSLVLADFVSVVDVKSSGGITVTGGITETELNKAIETAIAEVRTDYESQIAALEFSMSEDLPIGTVALWTSSTLPAGWIEMNGQSTSSYPDLASIVGSFVPDMRGNFARGWDHGAGVDTNRALKSFQDDAIRNITGRIPFIATWEDVDATGAFSWEINRSIASTIRTDKTARDALLFDASQVVPTADDNRPKNIALIYIIKAE